jgi:hypothetical protein
MVWSRGLSDVAVIQSRGSRKSEAAARRMRCSAPAVTVARGPTLPP